MNLWLPLHHKKINDHLNQKEESSSSDEEYDVIKVLAESLLPKLSKSAALQYMFITLSQHLTTTATLYLVKSTYQQMDFKVKIIGHTVAKLVYHC